MLIALMMKGQTQHVSEPRRHQQWYLMRLSQLNYPQGNKDGGQHLLLPTDIYKTCWVLSSGKQFVAPSDVMEDGSSSTFFKNHHHKHNKHINIQCL